jgi:hypothetical protein
MFLKAGKEIMIRLMMYWFWGLNYKTMRYLVFIFFFISYISNAQINEGGNLEEYIGDIIDNMPYMYGNDFIEPTYDEMESWNALILSVINHDYTTANIQANNLGYELIHFTDFDTVQEEYYILKERETTQKYWGTYVFNPYACRPNLIIQTPHSRYDYNTGKQGIYCFKRLYAGVYFCNGTHRCNHTDPSPCDGTSSICTGTSDNYRISDLAHYTNTVFQKTTEVLYNEFENPFFVQLHGFSKLSTDPYLIMSNGTRYSPDVDYLSLLAEELFEIDTVLTFKIANIDLDWTRLISTSNVQGRLINNSTDPCDIAANYSEGRFLHIEQEKSRLRQDTEGWSKMYHALANVFPCETASNASIKVSNDDVYVIPNPSKGLFKIIGLEENSEIQIYNMMGMKVYKSLCEESEQSFNLSNQRKGIYLISVCSDGKINKQKVIIF